MILTRENQSSQRKTCSSDTLFTTNLIWSGLGFFFSLFGYTRLPKARNLQATTVTKCGYN